jgi:hypothetical protein
MGCLQERDENFLGDQRRQEDKKVVNFPTAVEEEDLLGDV